MKKLFLLILVIGIVLGDYLPGRMIIQIEPEYETKCTKTDDGFFSVGLEHIDNVLKHYNAKSGKYLVPVRKMNEHYASKAHYWRNLYVINLADKSLDMEAVSAEFRNLDGIIDACPDYLENDMETIPSDELYSHQWHLEHINAHKVWDFTTGDSSIICTNFESVDWQHPDIAPLLWNNLGEDADGDGHTIERRLNWSFYGDYEYYLDPGDLNGIDDDGNGYVDDLIGWDFIDFTGDPLDDEYVVDVEDYFEEDNNPGDDVGEIGHGTHVAGTMLGAANNDGLGTVGVAWTGRLMALRGGYHYLRDGHDLTGTHPYSFSISAYIYAKDMEARVWNMSYGGNSRNGIVEQALRQAQDSSKAFMAAAAGNEADDESHYPSSYVGVMSVAALDAEDRASDFTSYGRRVAICAPGEDIYAPVPLKTYGEVRELPYEGKNGTSMASPQVAGAGIIMISQYPDFDGRDVYARLQDYAVDIPDTLYEMDLLGEGRLNLFNAMYMDTFPLFYLDSIAILPAPDDVDGRIDVGETGYVYVSYHCDAEWQDPGELILNLESSHEGIDIVESGIVLDDIAPGESVDNFDSPLIFTVNEALDEGEFVTFDVILNEESGYFKKDTISEMIGYPHLLLYDRDGGELVETYVFEDLQIGATYYEHYDADLLGPIESEFLNNNFRIVLFLNGRNDSIPILADEIDIFSDFLDIPNNCMYLAGQYLADDPSITDFLSTYFATEHIADEVASRFWGMNTVGVAGDTVGDGMNIDVTMGAGAFGAQHSIGQCRAIGDGVNVFYYDGHDDVFCATRYETPTNKTFFSEFSIAGVEADNPGANTRFQLLAKVIEWFGLPFTAIEEEIAEIPQELDIVSYPNPFNSAVNFRVNDGNAKEIRILNTAGKLIDIVPIESNLARWNPKAEFSSGVYLYSIESGDKLNTGRVLYIK